MTRSERFPCVSGDHRYHWSSEAAMVCQQQIEVLRAGRPFGDDPRRQHVDDQQDQQPPRSEVKPI